MKKLLLFLALFVVTALGISYFRGDIDNMKYAEPTEEVANFDLVAHIESLSAVEFDRIDYAIQERISYGFNRFILTLDLPEGYEAYKLSRPGDMDVVRTHDIQDSCRRVGGLRSGDIGPCKGQWTDASIISDKSLCILPSSASGNTNRCEGIRITPVKSRYTGVSLADYVYHVVANKSNYPYRLSATNTSFLVSQGGNNLSLIVGQEQLIEVSIPEELIDEATSKNLFYSIADSIEINCGDGQQVLALNGCLEPPGL